MFNHILIHLGNTEDFLTGCRQIHLHLYQPTYVLNILDVLKVVDQDLIDGTIQDIDTFAPPSRCKETSSQKAPNRGTPMVSKGVLSKIYVSKVQKYTSNAVQPQVKTVEHLKAAPVRLGHVADG
jgi:hypothetical protein